LSGTPRILGVAEPESTVRVYADPACAGTPIASGSAAELSSPGIAIGVAEGVTASFSATATDAEGAASPCSAPISYTRLKTNDGGPPPPPPLRCVVPKLAGRTLARAKAALTAASCKLGTVRRRPKGRKLGPFVVRSSKPGVGAILEVDSKIDLKLGPKPRKMRR
jgi:hypothetical protein